MTRPSTRPRPARRWRCRWFRKSPSFSFRRRGLRGRRRLRQLRRRVAERAILSIKLCVSADVGAQTGVVYFVRRGRGAIGGADGVVKASRLGIGGGEGVQQGGVLLPAG